MRTKTMDIGLAQTIAWIWLGFLVVGAIAWVAYRHWRRRHPPAPPPAPERSYSERLEQRLSKRQDATSRKRSKGSAKSPPGPHRL